MPEEFSIEGICRKKTEEIRSNAISSKKEYQCNCFYLTITWNYKKITQKCNKKVNNDSDEISIKVLEINSVKRNIWLQKTMESEEKII